MRQGSDRRRDRHVVVIEHDKKWRLRKMARMVDRLQGHSPGEGSIADHRDTTEILSAVITGHRHSQSGGN